VTDDGSTGEDRFLRRDVRENDGIALITVHLQWPTLHDVDPIRPVRTGVVSLVLQAVGNVDGELDVDLAAVYLPKLDEHLPEVRYEGGPGEQAIEGQRPREATVHVVARGEFPIPLCEEGQRKGNPLFEEIDEVDAPEALLVQVEKIDATLAVKTDVCR
jgi:hypothetical protein